LVPFALVVFFLAIVMLSTHRLPWVANTGGFILSAGAAVVLAFIFNAGLAKLFANEQYPSLDSRIAFGLVILAWGPFMAFHLYNIPELDAILIRAANDSFLNSIFNTIPITLLFVLQFTVVMFAAICTAVCFWRICVHQAECDRKTGLGPWKLIFAICAVYLSATIVLILP
jgi:hypothetical protein